MVGSGETSSSGDKTTHGEATRGGGARRYFKIPPMIDHQAGSFLADRLRLLGALLMPLHWPRFLLVSLFVVAAVVIAIILEISGNGLTQSIFPSADLGPTTDTTPVAPSPDGPASQAQLDTQLQAMEEKLSYTERKLAAALSQLREANTTNVNISNTDILGTAIQQGQRAALMLALGTGRPYTELLGNIDQDWLALKDMAALRRHAGQGFYDASHLARRLSALLESDPQTLQDLTQTLPPALAWLSRYSGGLVAVRPQAVAGIADAKQDILQSLVAGRPEVALVLVDEIFAEALEGKTDMPSALRLWRNDLAVWRTVAPVVARAHAAYSEQAAPDDVSE